MPITLGQHLLSSQFALAPMAGLSDVPFRTLAWRFGAGHMVSEMVSSKPDLWDTGKSRQRRVPVPGVSPAAVQLAGTDPLTLATAAARHVDDGVDVIDLNFGCPAKKVCKKLAGSALLADLSLIGEIVSAVVAAVPVPVTVKTRTGLVPGDGLGLQAALIAEDAGAQMVVMHGRSRACRFVGPVDYSAIAQVKMNVTIPVLANGDIRCVADAENALALSNADGLMVGRGALGQPWLFASLMGKPEPGYAEKWELVQEHLVMMHEFYGELAGARIARKHVAAYAKTLGFGDHGIELKEFQKIDSASGQVRWLQHASDVANGNFVSAVA